MTATIEVVQSKLTQLRATVAANTPAIHSIGDGYDMTPVTYQWHCHYCKRGFETEGIACFKAPAVMICRECSDRYDEKVMANYELTQVQRNAAYGVVNMDVRSPERREIMARWHQLSQGGGIHECAKFQKMIMLVNDCDSGKASAPAPKQAGTKKKGKGW